MQREDGRIKLRDDKPKSRTWLDNVSPTVMRILTLGKSRKQLAREGNREVLELIDAKLDDYRSRIERCHGIAQLHDNQGWLDIRVMLQRIMDERQAALPRKMVLSYEQSNPVAVLDAIEHELCRFLMTAIDDGIKKAGTRGKEAQERYDATMADLHPEGN